MQVFRRITILIFLLLLSGCILTKEVKEFVPQVTTVEKPVLHPKLPTAPGVGYYPPYVITKETIEKHPDNVVFQCFTWDDGQLLRKDLEANTAYIEELLAIVCHYRKDKEIKDKICKIFDDK